MEEKIKKETVNWVEIVLVAKEYSLLNKDGCRKLILCYYGSERV